MLPSMRQPYSEVSNLSTDVAGTRPCGASAARTTRWCRPFSYIASTYFLFVVMCRCLLRSARAQTFDWLLVATLEDSISLLSFALGLLYLHYSEGSALSILLRKGSTDNHSAYAADNALRPADAAAARDARRPIRLFYFAM
mmetsp:Transcript_23045/g.52891  ORF Transcript_23045/g.52891 Transcript_23045/m.52891 type:complete len:141 (+) Transcript_23045:138-560(+)